jgi:hypothetical protein
VNDIWKEYEYTFGYIHSFIPESRRFILSRPFYYEGKTKYDTLKYFQGEFINDNERCLIGFQELKFYATSSWRSTPNQYITIFANGSLYREDYELHESATYKGRLRSSFFDSLLNLICEVNPEYLDSSYEMLYVRDVATIHLRIKNGNQIKRIDDYGEWGNFGLGAIYKMLWRINKEAEWTLLTEKRIERIPKLKSMPGDN